MSDRTTKFQVDPLANTPATDDMLKKLQGFQIPVFDNLIITYVSAGNGVGEIQTVVYRLVNVTVATLTLTYNVNNKLLTVTKS